MASLSLRVSLKLLSALEQRAIAIRFEDGSLAPTSERMEDRFVDGCNGTIVLDISSMLSPSVASYKLQPF
jgi:hypothetical protein